MPKGTFYEHNLKQGGMNYRLHLQIHYENTNNKYLSSKLVNSRNLLSSLVVLHAQQKIRFMNEIESLTYSINELPTSFSSTIRELFQQLTRFKFRTLHLMIGVHLLYFTLYQKVRFMNEYESPIYSTNELPTSF